MGTRHVEPEAHFLYFQGETGGIGESTADEGYISDG